MSEKIPVKRYSQAFKRQVVREYEAGASLYALCNKYGIGGYNTVKRWVKQLGRSGYRSEKVVIQSREDQQEFQQMKVKIAELESALAEAVIDNRMLTTVITVASDALEIDLKKTFGNK